MSEPTLPLTDISDWLSDLGEDTFALAWVDPQTDPLGPASAPVAGLVGAERPDFDHGRLALEEIVHGRLEAVRRWTLLEDGQRQLAIIGAGLGTLREYAPGALAATVPPTAQNDQALTALLSDWLQRRNAQAPQGLELGWITAATAWSFHMRDLTFAPPPSVAARALANAGERDEAIGDLVTDTAMNVTGLIGRRESAYRTRDELADAWRAVEARTADVPVLQETADWLLDQIALRDPNAQRLRAVLEPDITDYIIDRRAQDRAPGSPRPVLDPQRTAHLGQARETVRAYTAAAHGGREHAARQLLDAFAIPARSLEPSGPAAAWRSQSFTAHDAMTVLDEQRERTFAESSPDHYADPDPWTPPPSDPELLHATAAYLSTREAHLQILHDAMGRLAAPAALPELLPEELAGVAAGQTPRRVMEAFGSIDRAREVLDGLITYLQQQPVPPHRLDTTPEEIERLQAARHNLDPQPMSYDGRLDGDSISRRVKAIMDSTPSSSWRPTPRREAGQALTGQSQSQSQSQALAPSSTTPGIQP